MNLGQIRNRVLDFLREQSSPTGITAAELNRYINDGYRDMSERTLSVVEETTISVPGETPFVTFPTNSLAPLTFVDQTSDMPILPVHWTWIDRRDKLFVRKTRSRPSLIAAFGLYEALIYPAYTSGGGTIVLTHAIMPTELSSDTDTPSLPEQHHMGLVYYASHRVLLKDADGPRLGRALRQKKYYEETVDGLEVWGLSRHENLRTNVYSNNLPTASTIGEFG